MAAKELYGKLSATKVKQCKPKDKTYKLSDGQGLNLEVRSTGSKYWRLSYRFNKKQKTLALGVYPTITLAKARELTLSAKQDIQSGVDPSITKKQKQSDRIKTTFKHLTLNWHNKESGRWSTPHAKKVLSTLEADVFPFIGEFQITDIRSSDILKVIKKIEERGALDVASRIKQRISAVFRYAIQTDKAEFNPTDALKDVIKTRKVQHRKCLKEKQLPFFLKALDNYQGYALTKYALLLITHTFVRPGELRSAEWKDIDLDNKSWRIPPEKMKMNEEHIVPLSSQVIEILKSIKKISGGYDLVFPGSHNFRKPMSENTLGFAIQKRLKLDATAHGFRSTASTILNEEGFRIDVIERQLAHGERNKVRAAYNRSQYLQERTKMMQWYSNHLDKLKEK